MSCSGSYRLRTPVEWHSEHITFQFWAGRVQWSQSVGGITWSGYSEYQRFFWTSQAMVRDCSRPPGKGMRYCWSGNHPKV